MGLYANLAKKKVFTHRCKWVFTCLGRVLSFHLCCGSRKGYSSSVLKKHFSVTNIPSFTHLTNHLSSEHLCCCSQISDFFTWSEGEQLSPEELALLSWAMCSTRRAVDWFIWCTAFTTLTNKYNIVVSTLFVLLGVSTSLSPAHLTATHLTISPMSLKKIFLMDKNYNNT